MFSEGNSELAPLAAPIWGWRAELQIENTNHIELTAYFITSDGQEAMAIQTKLARLN
jgi:hypothetical protein